MTPADFDTFANMLKAKSGLIIGPDKTYLLESRLQSIMKRENIASFGAFAAALRAPGSERLARDTVEAMTTNESFFFRDEKPFNHLRAKGLPAMIAARPPEQPIRIWSAAASSGQEAYSLAMIVADGQAMLQGRLVDIVGTDIAREQLARARDGLYTQFEVQRGLPMTMLAKHFKKESTGWRISEALRARVMFNEFNLLGDLRPLGRFDIVFCRNVLIYFDQPTKARVLRAIAQIMPPDGLLYLGGAETVIGVTDAFRPCVGEHGVFSPVVTAGERVGPA